MKSRVSDAARSVMASSDSCVSKASPRAICVWRSDASCSMFMPM